MTPQRLLVLLAGGALACVAVAPLLAPPASAALQPCAATDISDPPMDVGVTPSGVPDALTGFDRIDVTTVCLTETATHLHVVITVRANVDSNAVTGYSYTLRFKADGVSIAGCTHQVRGGAMPAVAPECPAESVNNQPKVQFNLAKSRFVPGLRLTEFVVETAGDFVDVMMGVVNGADRAPNAGSAALTYTVGARSPPGTDSDGDGLEDAVEVEVGSDPGKPDTDGDGLKDGAETTSDPTKADSDGDGLLDGDNLTVPTGPAATNLSRGGAVQLPDAPAGRASFAGERGFGADPRRPDTDADGLTDGDEASGRQNLGYPTNMTYPGLPGSTNPAAADTDGDDLSDGDEVSGATSLGGQTKRFAPTDPNRADTDGDGLNDLEELSGLQVTPSGDRITWTPTDPTQRDSDGDGVDDFTEVREGTDPNDAGSKPSTGGATDVVTYLPLSAALLILVSLVSVAGILWRWG